MAVVYSRELDGTVLTFAPSGWTYGESIQVSVFVLIDKETQSMWFPMADGDCCSLVGIGGTYADERIEGIMRMERTSWFKWVAEHPHTKFVLD
jgi:hypothetical protein